MSLTHRLTISRWTTGPCLGWGDRLRACWHPANDGTHGSRICFGQDRDRMDGDGQRRWVFSSFCRKRRMERSTLNIQRSTSMAEKRQNVEVISSFWRNRRFVGWGRMGPIRRMGAMGSLEVFSSFGRNAASGVGEDFDGLNGPGPRLFSSFCGKQPIRKPQSEIRNHLAGLFALRAPLYLTSPFAPLLSRSLFAAAGCLHRAYLP